MNVIIVGCGAMGGAVLSGCLEKGIWKRREVKILSKNEKSSKEKAEKYGVFYIKDEKEIEEADVVLIAVKPHIVPSVLDKISKYGPKHVISLAAAVTLS
ncbi:MAG: NAD(P)-binding domain-containing protein, partial [Dialister micraerophilus]|nr:NAD(P)-binding domain-containing protein [Dialister micraerophilus]